jgi:hypothetical protein
MFFTMDPSVLESCKVCLTWHTVPVGIRPGGSLDPHATVARQTLAVRDQCAPSAGRCTLATATASLSIDFSKYFSIDFCKYFFPSADATTIPNKPSNDSVVPDNRRECYACHTAITTCNAPAHQLRVLWLEATAGILCPHICP